MLRKLFSTSDQSAIPFALDRVDQNKIPFLDATTLYRSLDQTNRLRTLSRLSGVDDESFEKLFKPAIDRFVVAAQLMPASTVDHHSSLGGLIVHTLEVVETAMRLRKSQVLPKNAPTERILEEEHVWTYAIFAGALLHDAGKLLTLCRCVYDNGRIHSPFIESPPTDKHYSIEFKKSNYELQTKSSVLLFGLIPTLGQRMISQNESALTQVTAWLTHNDTEWGVVGSIVRDADMASTSANLRMGGRRPYLAGSGQAPMADKLITGIRKAIVKGTFTINTPGSMMYMDMNNAYLICPKGAEVLIGFLNDNGYAGIPNDTTRIYNELQRVSYITPSSENKALWRVDFETDILNGTLHVLVFPRDAVIPESEMPEPIDGTILPNPIQNPSDEEEALAKQGSTDDKAENIDGEGETPDSTDKQPDASDESSDTASNSFTVETPSAKDDDQTDDETPDTPIPSTNKASSVPSTSKNNEIKSPDKSKYPDVRDIESGVLFLKWIRDRVSSSQIRINKKDAPLHVIPEGAFVCSPFLFYEYIDTFNLAKSTDKQAREVAMSNLQNTVGKLKANHQGPLRHSVIKVKLVGKESRVLSGFLFDVELVFGSNDIPAPNTAIRPIKEGDIHKRSKTWETLNKDLPAMIEKQKKGRKAVSPKQATDQKEAENPI